jgi:hypothetical protein
MKTDIKRKFLFAFSAALAFVFLSGQVWAGVRQQGSVWIVDDAEGFAPVRNGNENAARAEAQRMAQRDAVERAMGALVSGVTVMEKYEVVKDKVFSQTEGVVKKFETLREKVDGDGLLTLTARCEVGAADLEGVLGPVMIDTIGNPRVMILVDEAFKDGQGDKRPFVSTTETVTLEVFEKAGYQLVDPDQARALLNIDAAGAFDDPGKLLDAARTLNADVIVVGRAYGAAHTPNPVNVSGQALWGLTSTVQLKAVLTDTAYQIGSQAVEKKTRGLSVETGVAQGFKDATPEAARSIVYKAAYALAGLGLGGGIPGITVKLRITDIPSLKTVESIEEFLQELAGKSGGVYRRRFENRAVEIDVVSEKNMNSVASSLSDIGVEVDGTKFQVISGRYAESAAAEPAGKTPPSVAVRITDVPSFKEAGAIEDALLELAGQDGKTEVEYKDKILEVRIVSDRTARDIASFLEEKGIEITGRTAQSVEGKVNAEAKKSGGWW